MYKIEQAATPGSLTPSSPTPVLIPSFAAGGASATQQGFTITVNTTLPHNISSDANDRISGFGVSVYLEFESTRILTGIYTNIVVVSTTGFTCTSATYSEVQSPISLTTLASTHVVFTSMAVTIPYNSLQPGSSIRSECFLHLPDGVARLANNDTTRVGTFFGNTLDRDPYKNQAFFSDSVIGTADTSYYMHSMTVFLDNKTNSDFFTTISGGPAYQNTIKKQVNNTFGINLADAIIVCPSISFSSAEVNDYVMCSMMRVQIAL
jgi:hypothetical protein